jgi:hypothetical protein
MSSLCTGVEGPDGLVWFTLGENRWPRSLFIADAAPGSQAHLALEQRLNGVIAAGSEGGVVVA